jgi:signal transduction histidine kinase
MGTVWASALLLAHFGLFLLWQPLWQGDGELRPAQALLVIALGMLLATLNNWWAIAVWLAALISLTGGGVPGLTQRGQRLASLLAALYLLALLLIWVVPQLAGEPPANTTLVALVRYGLPLVAAAILFVRAAPARSATPIAVDVFYSLMLFLLVAALVLGSLVLQSANQGQYLLALAETLILIAAALVALSWLMSPTAGFAGFNQLLSRYLMSVGLPFEQWVQRLAQIAEHESEPRRFLDAALEHILALPWVIGLRWETPLGSGHYGRLNEHYAEFVVDELKLNIHTRWALSPAMLLHVKLLAQMIGHFYAAKLREQLQRRDAYTQAIHETGSRLTHDVKNLLQSLHALCAAAQDNTPGQSAALLALMQRQLPQITQRLSVTLDKLGAPAQTESRQMAAHAWWATLRQRYAYRNVHFTLQSGEGLSVGSGGAGETVPAEAFDSIADNLIENALRKAAEVQVTFDARRLILIVRDGGEAVPRALAAQLFTSPVSSSAGLGVGLYHAARLATQHGYTLKLAVNEPGDVRFQLSPEIDNKNNQ